jgi:peptidoglycan LD-endopeptidase CwlK
MAFSFSRRSLNNFRGVHVDLVRVMNLGLALTTVDFGIINGVRTGAQQHAFFVAGASQIDWPTKLGEATPRHVTGHAVDVFAYVNGIGSWDAPLYEEISDAVKTAAAKIHVAVVWGGDWHTLKDLGHFELDRTTYPDAPLVA